MQEEGGVIQAQDNDNTATRLIEGSSLMKNFEKLKLLLKGKD